MSTTGYKLRDEFELWVDNQLLLVRRTDQGHTDEYESPWTAGAWAAWKECHERSKLPAPDHMTISRDQWDDAIRGLGTKA